jgi:hypothetical protein
MEQQAQYHLKRRYGKQGQEKYHYRHFLSPV